MKHKYPIRGLIGFGVGWEQEEEIGLQLIKEEKTMSRLKHRISILLCLLFALGSVLLFVEESEAKRVYVKGYYRDHLSHHES